MSRLPSALQPAWPLFKRLHRLTTLICGFATRPLSRLAKGRALPRRAFTLSADTAAHEPGAVTLHVGDVSERINRPLPSGDPEGHWRFADARSLDVPPHFVLELADGAVAGDWGATITAGGTLDMETSEYFGIAGWREHPVFLAAAVPPVERVDGSVVSLTTRGGNRNYYHFLMDVLPRWGVFQECVPGHQPDAVYVPRETPYQEQLLSLLDLDRFPIIPVTPARTVRASTLFVPCLQNPVEMAPSWTVSWLRERLPPKAIADRASRLYVTRGSGRNTRRLVQEELIWPELQKRGFVRVDPGSLSVREQIDTFAAAEVIVGLHGAAMTNVVFAQPGVRILEVFPSNYVKPCFWAIAENIPDAHYEYLVAGRPAPDDRGQSMLGIQDDIDVDVERFCSAVDRLLDA